MSTYKKHTWGSGIPNRKKFDEMDSEIQRLAEGGGGLPPTGNLHEILKVGSSGPMWGKADSDFVNYIDTPTHENGSVGAKLSELSEKIENIKPIIIDTTEARNVGTYIYMDGDVKKSKPIYVKTILTSSYGEQPHNIQNIDRVLKLDGLMHSNCSWDYSDGFYTASDSRYDIGIGPTTLLLAATKNDITPQGVTYVYISVYYTRTTDTPTVIE